MTRPEEGLLKAPADANARVSRFFRIFEALRQYSCDRQTEVDMSQEAGEKRFVAYYRVSTARQGQSGLGLEAQKASVAQFIKHRGGVLTEEFTEVETGKGKNALSKRPQLAAALAACKRGRFQLVIAKLDRLARNVHFISGLMETNVDFIAVDCETKDRFRLHLEACFAEEEARRISDRTKQALAACKARGVKLGKHGKVLAKKNKKEARAFANTLSSTITEIRDNGHTTVRAITAELNDRGVPAARGGQWSARTTHRLLQRLAAA
jgi:DNA invertase Pin-like site-specific DNA recombinase